MAQITLTINADSPSDLAAALAGLAGGTPAAPKAATAKVEQSVAPKATPAKEKAEPEPKQEDGAQAGAQAGVSLEQVKAAMAAYDKANGRDALKELLGSFGIKNISALPEDQFAAFIEKCGQ